jgi:hypothetical protein
MLRRTPLRRKTWMRARSSTSSYRLRPRAIAFMQFVRSLPCSAGGMGECRGPIEADHAGRRGIGQKADDLTCIPLCRAHHDQRHHFTGAFKGWTKTQMRAFLIGCIAITQLAAAERGVSMEAA